jgi:hypothetical protein
MRVEFHEPDAPDAVVATAVWEGAQVEVESSDEARADEVRRIFRPTSVAIDDPSLRAQGTHGDVLIQPGSLVWFRAVCKARAREAGLVARFVSGSIEGGYDPAAGYRPFEEAIERLTTPRS